MISIATQKKIFSRNRSLQFAQEKKYKNYSSDRVEKTNLPIFHCAMLTATPRATGPEYEDFRTPVNTIVLQSGEEDGSLSDPLNVIPDDYLYDEYDPNDIPADQARPEELVTYEEQPTYGSDPATEAPSPAYTESSAPLPAFDANLRETIEFSTAGPIDPVQDIAITTYSPEIDFDLGTTSSEGIEVVNLVTAVEEDPSEYLDDALAGSNYIDESAPLYDDEYEDTITSYQPDNVDIPIVVEEASPVTVDLPSYDPVVLLVGTPEKVGPLAGLHAESSSEPIHLPST